MNGFGQPQCAGVGNDLIRLAIKVFFAALASGVSAAKQSLIQRAAKVCSKPNVVLDKSPENFDNAAKRNRALYYFRFVGPDVADRRTTDDPKIKRSSIASQSRFAAR